ncbi:MAG: smc 1 [Gammaproteobacteria bacterium]|jgi:chromosome segregation protein|nr:smc 1 [Gammaproteobacteria bacterium]
MHLKKIKLAGFKSFVDPTTVLVPSNLIAVVGPNGCGKSNIIDAVCWVMGESSAKYLRGETLTDVIFNGSSARKPVGQASVELVFDNQEGPLGGEYASYAEISIRRQISRDAESAYFLNGSRCRRRDVIDIFLGTGLGPRSYSIIGQNMISRVIEAKPDDLRIYLEEAAGVSRYKERRRETENRIQHTKDNMARLNDVRAELETQLNTLQRQANAAEKFKILKEEERLVRGQSYAIQWRQLDHKLVEDSLLIQQKATQLEAHQTEVSDINLQIDYQRETERAINEKYQEVQRLYYVIGNDIARLEQEIQHHEERSRQWVAESQRIDTDTSAISHQIKTLENQLEENQEEEQQLELESQDATHAVKSALDRLSQTEEMMQIGQSQWDEFNQGIAATTQTAQVEQTRIQHLEQKMATLKQRQAQLNQDKPQFDFPKLENEIAILSEQVSMIETKKAEQDAALSETRQQIADLQMLREQTLQELDQVRNELQQWRGQTASLEALQQTALGQRNNAIIPWLAEHQLDQLPRLAQEITVESGWEQAVEKVLGAYLQAVCVNDLSDVSSYLSKLNTGSLSVFSRQSPPIELNQSQNTRLLSKVKSSLPLEGLLADVYIAESFEDALKQSKSLASHESVVTREGVWLGASWLRVMREESPEAGVFQRQQDLKQLAEQIAQAVERHHQLEQNLNQQNDSLKTFETKLADLQKNVNQLHIHLAEHRASHKMKQNQMMDLQARAERFHQELTENIEQLEETELSLTQSRDTWQRAMRTLEEQSKEREIINQRRTIQRDELQEARDQLDQLKEDAHQLKIRLQANQSQQAATQQAIQRLNEQLANLSERKTGLQNEMDAAQPIEIRQKELADRLNSRLEIEADLSKTRVATELAQQELSRLEARRLEIEREITHSRDCLETARIESQGVKVKAETVKEQLQETGLQLEELLQSLPEEAVLNEWLTRLESITQRIHRLGAINLVAIEEYATCSERKNYLDQQFDDLQTGLTTLEEAIAKIDKETRAKFKETFDKVNARFQELFPIIFGGGKAYLELTGENLLDSGIILMACPPGKRNSSIHLLSGGEKAMTAIALVFSIFHLNPAPFCLLDEVDAPLDDANIGRFCDLVKKMAEKTQFIFISHNKLAIEMGEHLIGVTMNEPGVSRLVSVNVQEAISLAEA